jgi:hypothetical protein
LASVVAAAALTLLGERAHGRGERIGITAFSEELAFTYRLMKVLVGRSAAGVVSPGP